MVWTDDAKGPSENVNPQKLVELGNGTQKFSRFGLAPTGTFDANGTTAVVVSDASVTADSLILWSLKTAGGTPGAVYESADKVPGTSFTVKSAAGNTSTYAYWIIG